MFSCKLYRLSDRSRETLTQHEGDLTFPFGFIEDISSAPTRDTLLATIAIWLPRLFTADRASLTLAHDDQHLSIVAFDGSNAIPLDQLIPIDKSTTGRAFRNKEIWVTSDTAKDSHEFIDLKMLSSHGLMSCINVPLLMSGKCFGCLNLGHHSYGAYDNVDYIRLRGLVFWIFVAINRSLITFKSYDQLSLIRWPVAG